MNNLINNLFKLVKSGYQCKRNIKKYLKVDKTSQTYILAKMYDDSLKAMEKSGSLTLAQVDTIIDQIDTHRIHYQGSEEALQFLSKVRCFFEELRPFVREKLA